MIETLGRLLESHWPSWRRDAAVQLVIGSFFLLLVVPGLLLGSRSGGGSPGPVEPPPFGTAITGPPAPDPTTAVKLDGTPPRRLPEAAKLPAPAPAPAPPPQSQPVKPEPSSDPNTVVIVDRADQSVANRPSETPVEKNPKPIARMNENELTETVAAYERWVHEGDLRLILNLSQVSTEQLAQAVKFYVLNGSRARVLADRTCRESRPINELPPGMLVGDLPEDKWPPALVAVGEKWLGSGFQASAHILLTPECQLRMYRLLAEAVKGQKVEPGMEVVMRLKPGKTKQDIDLELVSRRPAGKR